LAEIWLALYTGAVAMRKGPSRSLYVPALALGIAALCGGLVTGTVVASLRAPTPVARHLKAPQPYVVAIMPGHGGVDPGAISPFNGLKEKNVTLSMGLDLRRALQADGVKVAMTRTTDTDISISQAETLAVQSHANVLISLWVNDWSDASLEGATVFMPHQKDLALAQNLNSGMSAAIAPLGMGDRGTQPLPQLWVHAPMPAVTVEVGFMSNPQDSQLLAESSFRSVVAGALANGLLAYAPQIPRIETRLVAYKRAEAKVVAAARAATVRAASQRQIDRWLPALLLLDGILVLGLYRAPIVRRLRQRAPALVDTGLAGAKVMAGAGGATMDAIWRGATRAGRRPSRKPALASRSSRRPGVERHRRPPREWRGKAATVHPRRVTEMVQPGDRGDRRSIYDDFSF
jgi:N-acetylmuramoyl-L-alanine amidase